MSNEKHDECPLTPSQLRLLRACISARTTNSKELARILNIRPATVRTHFEAILERLEQHDRYAALCAAIAKGYVAEQ